MYNNANVGIRQVDDLHIIFFEGVTWDDIGNGFDGVPGGPDYANRSALSYHYYDPPNLDLNTTFTARMDDLKRIGCAGMLTEFSTGGATPNDIEQAINTTQVAEQNLQSWIGWEYKKFIGITGWSWGLFCPNGSINTPLVKALARTYAPAVAGIVSVSHFDQYTAVYTLTYTMNQNSELPTEIYLSEEFYYPNGYTVQLFPSYSATWNTTSKNQIYITRNLGATGTITIIISPNSTVLQY